jgi:phospholipase C
MVGRLRTLSLLTLLALVAVMAMGGTAAAGGTDRLSKIDHIVVIDQENHSFDNLYGMWEGVRGLRDARGPGPSRSTRPAGRTGACSRTTST